METTTLSDSEIVALVLSGKTDHFAVLIERYERLLVSFLLGHVYRVADVEDIAQEIFLKAFRFLGTFDLNRKFPAWLTGIARNHLIDYYRKEKGTAPAGDEIIEYISQQKQENRIGDPEAELDKKENYREILTSIFALPEIMKVPFLLRLVQGLSYEEIAEALDLPLQTVKNRIFKARQRLREEREKGKI